jgi:hypothetical protein
MGDSSVQKRTGVGMDIKGRMGDITQCRKFLKDRKDRTYNSKKYNYKTSNVTKHMQTKRLKRNKV